MLKWQIDDWKSLDGWEELHLSKIERNKLRLLEMARNGEPRPICHKDPLGTILFNYTNQNNLSYDLTFDEQVRKVRPDWFVTVYDLAKDKKKQLLEMARNGEPRPTKRDHKLGIALCSYTNQQSNCFDAKFNAKIRNARPDWFVSRTDVADQKKKQLLEMARNGEPRPSQRNHPLGTMLRSYTTSTDSFDAKFNIEIRNARPDWFVSRTDVADQKKKQLLEMARNGEPRPSQRNHPLGGMLYCYTNSKNSNFDSDFNIEIRITRPDWFVAIYDLVKKKKKQLLEMARNGEPRPNQKNHPLGGMLCCYTNSKNKCFDANFNIKIRKVRPDWFKD